MIDPLGPLVVEVRNVAAIDALVHGRVRGGEPAPPMLHPDTGLVIKQGDARGPGEYVPFIVLSRLDPLPDPDLPIQWLKVAANCYGVTFQNAAEVYGALVEAVHRIGPRMKANGLGIYVSNVTGGGGAVKDPDTNQPFETAIIELIATAQAVTA